jgi:uncharacterized protein (DUF58 family)
MVRESRYIILLAAVAVLLFVGVGESSAAPRVQVDQTVYDAGPIPEGKEINHEFVLKNVGDKTLSFKIKPC